MGTSYIVALSRTGSGQDHGWQIEVVPSKFDESVMPRAFFKFLGRSLEPLQISEEMPLKLGNSSAGSNVHERSTDCDFLHEQSARRSTVQETAAKIRQWVTATETKRQRIVTKAEGLVFRCS